MKMNVQTFLEFKEDEPYTIHGTHMSCFLWTKIPPNWTQASLKRDVALAPVGQTASSETQTCKAAAARAPVCSWSVFELTWFFDKRSETKRSETAAGGVCWLAALRMHSIIAVCNTKQRRNKSLFLRFVPLASAALISSTSTAATFTRIRFVSRSVILMREVWKGMHGPTSVFMSYCNPRPLDVRYTNTDHWCGLLEFIELRTEIPGQNRTTVVQRVLKNSTCRSGFTKCVIVP